MLANVDMASSAQAAAARAAPGTGGIHHIKSCSAKARRVMGTESFLTRKWYFEWYPSLCSFSLVNVLSVSRQEPQRGAERPASARRPVMPTVNNVIGGVSTACCAYNFYPRVHIVKVARVNKYHLFVNCTRRRCSVSVVAYSDISRVTTLYAYVSECTKVVDAPRARSARSRHSRRAHLRI